MTTRSRLLSALALLLSLAACGGDGTPAIEPPAITIQPVAAAVGIGERVTFSVQATGAAPITYQWRRDGVDVPGATSAGFEITVTVAGDDGAMIDVVVANPGGRVTSAAVRLTVSAPPLIVTHPADVTVRVGQTATFSVSATGGPQLSYFWKRFDGFIDGATAASYTTPQVTMADNGAMFSVVVGNGATSVASNEARLWVVP